MGVKRNSWFSTTSAVAGLEAGASYLDGITVGADGVGREGAGDGVRLDHYWQALSAVPESEQCGWLKDRYGISWQIVPKNLDELMTGDAQVRALMGMKKIVIADLVAAG